MSETPRRGWWSRLVTALRGQRTPGRVRLRQRPNPAAPQAAWMAATVTAAPQAPVHHAPMPCHVPTVHHAPPPPC